MSNTNEFLLGEMNAKLDTLINRSVEDRLNIAKLEERVQFLEAFRWTLLGAAVASGGAAGMLSKIFSS